MPKGYTVLTQDERRQFKNFRDANSELNYNRARYKFFKQIGKLDYDYKPHNSRLLGFASKQVREHVEVIPDTEAKYGWSVFCDGSYKNILTPKETHSKKQHLYVYVTVGGEKHRIMSLASLIWLCYLKKDIPAGCVIDHIDEDPLNNDVSNLRCLTNGDNVREAARNRARK